MSAGLPEREGRILLIEDGVLTVQFGSVDGGPVLVADFPSELLGGTAGDARAGDLVSLTAQGGDGYDSLRLRPLGVWTAEELLRVRVRARDLHTRLLPAID